MLKYFDPNNPDSSPVQNKNNTLLFNGYPLLERAFNAFATAINADVPVALSSAPLYISHSEFQVVKVR